MSKLLDLDKPHVCDCNQLYPMTDGTICGPNCVHKDCSCPDLWKGIQIIHQLGLNTAQMETAMQTFFCNKPNCKNRSEKMATSMPPDWPYENPFTQLSHHL